MKKRRARIAFAIALILGLTFFRSPIYALLYQAIHGKYLAMANYRLSIPRWYAPIASGQNAAKAVYISAGNSIPHQARVIGLMEANSSETTYESTRQFVQQSLHATSLINERQIQTPVGYAKCSEVILTKGIEADCWWESGPMRAVYIGPAGFKSEFYETVQSVEIAR
jgi:hypothetical protein